MIDFIPGKYYKDIFYFGLWLVVIVAIFHTQILKHDSQKAIGFNTVAGWLLFISVFALIGFRPIDGAFIDMTTYAHIFQRYQFGNYSIESDYGFNYFILGCTKIMTVEWFFTICAIIYIVPLFLVSKKWFPNYYFYAFLLFVASMSFFAYGTNGIRNGMATSLFIMALYFYRANTALMIFFFVLAYSFHNSMLLAIAAFIVSFFLTDTKKYYFFYLLAILLSITMGGIWENLFASLGFGDDRFANYLTKSADESRFASTGFRYDFLLYSAAPILLSFNYKYIKGYESVIYTRILNTYIIANGFWVMVIRANYSNRFAYLSWFLMAIVIFYPLLDKQLWNDQFKKLGYIIFLYFFFTYFIMYLLR